jgi:hypothetical protein
MIALKCPLIVACEMQSYSCSRSSRYFARLHEARQIVVPATVADDFAVRTHFLKTFYLRIGSDSALTCAIAARAASGHATTVLLKSLNSRRLMGFTPVALIGTFPVRLVQSRYWRKNTMSEKPNILLVHGADAAGREGEQPGEHQAADANGDGERAYDGRLSAR